MSSRAQATTDNAAIRLIPLGLLQVTLAAVLWGTVGITSKSLYGLADTDSLSIGFFRLAFAAPALLIAGHLATGDRLLRVSGRDLVRMAGIGAMMALYQATYFAAIPRVGVTVTTLVTLCTAPLFVALLATGLIGERLSRFTLLALPTALLGTALLINVNPVQVSSAEAVVGIGLALSAAMAYAALVLLSRTLANRYHPLQPIAIGFTLGAALLLGLTWLQPGGLALRYSPLGWLHLLYLGLVPTALGYFVFLAGMRTTPATTASIATLAEPLTSALLAWLLFDERLGPTSGLGAALLIGGLLLQYVDQRQR
jgi:DME family drug/metabolite transporter